MTLLLGALSRSGVVLAADGLCTVNREITNCRLQKIFPQLDRRTTIAHHGQNIIGGRDIRLIIRDFSESRKRLAAPGTVEHVARDLAAYIDDEARDTLASVGTENVIGFWVAGFGTEEGKPALFEVWWDCADRGARIEKSPKKDFGFIWGGSGQRFIDRSDIPPITSASGLGTLRRLVDGLYRLAERRQSREGAKEFGGHRHELSMSKSRWHWTIKPKPG